MAAQLAAAMNDPERGSPRALPSAPAPNLAWRTVAACALCCLFACQRSDSTGSPRTPLKANVVIYLVDTLRADRLGVYGYRQPTTPHIDALAADSVLFEHAYAPAPWTLPSVVSLMTSTLACQHQVVVDGQKLEESFTPLALRLQRAGYSSASFFANPYAGPMSGLDRGFAHRHAYPDAIDAAADAWLDTQPAEPFFIYIHTIEPHDPYDAPPALVAPFGEVSAETRALVNQALRRYRQLTRVDWDAGRPLGSTDNTDAQSAALRQLQHLESAIRILYDADVRLADQNLGRVIALLRRRQVWDRTLFILVSDHGEEFGERGGRQHDQSVYEELLHVPMMLRFPAGEFGGRRVRDVVSLLDILPTIVDRLGLPAAETVGHSLMPLVRGEPANTNGPFTIPSIRINRKKYFRPYKEGRGDVNVVIRTGNWKGIWNVEPRTFELYDLDRDALETKDLHDAHGDRVEAMRAFARDWLATCRDGPSRRPSETPLLDEAARERLRALGYAN